MANTKMFHCWIKSGTVNGSDLQRIQPPPAQEVPPEKRIQPPPASAAAASTPPDKTSVAQTLTPAPGPDFNPFRIQPPPAAPVIRLADMLDEAKLKRQTFQPAGYALAGWWNLEGINAGQTDPLAPIPNVALQAVYGTRDQALQWIASDEGKAWLGNAQTHFMVTFCCEAEA